MTEDVIRVRDVLLVLFLLPVMLVVGGWQLMVAVWHWATSKTHRHLEMTPTAELLLFIVLMLLTIAFAIGGFVLLDYKFPPR